MNTKLNHKKSVIAALGAAVAAAAVPAALFAGAGTAQATTEVTANPNDSGVTVHVKSTGIRLIAPLEVGGPGPLNEATLSSGACSYTAIPQTLGPIPVYNVPFTLTPGGTANLSFSGTQTGTTWDVTIHCNNGLDSPTQQLVY
jgi:hypothetical protein